MWKGVPVMCRNQKDIDTRIHRKCVFAGTDETKMIELGERLLNAFREVCNSNTQKANAVVGELCYTDEEFYDPSNEVRLMDQALLKLEVFAEEADRDKYKREIHNILQLAQMVKIMESLKYTVYSYGKYGPEFVSILTTCYMSSFDYTNEEASELLNMSESTFYRKKKRAVILFALAFLDYKAHWRGMDPIFQDEGDQVSMVI